MKINILGWNSNDVIYSEEKVRSEASEEFRWLLLQEEEQKNFGSCMGLNTDQWKTNDLYSSIENCSVPEPSDVTPINNTVVGNGALVSVLFCIIFVFFLLTTTLLVIVIYLSTRNVNIQENYSKSLNERYPTNLSMIYAQKCQQNNAEVRVVLNLL